MELDASYHEIIEKTAGNIRKWRTKLWDTNIFLFRQKTTTHLERLSGAAREVGVKPRECVRKERCLKTGMITKFSCFQEAM